jgi:hypothetical protein
VWRASRRNKGSAFSKTFLDCCILDQLACDEFREVSGVGLHASPNGPSQHECASNPYSHEPIAARAAALREWRTYSLRCAYACWSYVRHTVGRRLDRVSDPGHRADIQRVAAEYPAEPCNVDVASAPSSSIRKSDIVLALALCSFGLKLFHKKAIRWLGYWAAWHRSRPNQGEPLVG